MPSGCPTPLRQDHSCDDKILGGEGRGRSGFLRGCGWQHMAQPGWRGQAKCSSDTCGLDVVRPQLTHLSTANSFHSHRLQQLPPAAVSTFFPPRIPPYTPNRALCTLLQLLVHQNRVDGDFPTNNTFSLSPASTLFSLFPQLRLVPIPAVRAQAPGG